MERLLGPAVRQAARAPAVSDEEIVRTLEHNSASGWPFSQTLGSKKGEVLEKTTLSQLREHYASETPVLGSTLKDEVRPIGKDARLYRPAPLQMMVEAIELFQRQLDEQSAQIYEPGNPYGIGVTTPGPGMSGFWSYLRGPPGAPFKRFLHGDGKQWDASVRLLCVEVLASVRASHSPPSVRERMYRYYSHVYNGWTNILGHFFHLIGNASGHLLTGSDNSNLLAAIIFATVSYLGFDPYDTDNFRCKVLGDDLVIGTNYPLTATMLLRVMTDICGISYEFACEYTDDIRQCSFMGNRPVIHGLQVSHVYEHERLLPKLHWMNGSLADHCEKICQVAILLFYSSYYEPVRNFAYQFAHHFGLSRVEVPSLDLIGPHALVARYRGFQSRPARGKIDWIKGMEAIISKHGIPLGSTSDGRAWVAKALHPADTTARVVGIPAGDGFPSVCLEFEAEQVIAPPSALPSAANWDCSVFLLPHPIIPLSGFINQGGSASAFNQINPTLAAMVNPASSIYHTDLSVAFSRQAQQWRLAYCSVTLLLDAPALANQGSLAAAQVPFCFSRHNFTTVNSGVITAYSHVDNYAYATNYLNFPQLAQKPGAYTANAKDGCYMVLRLDPNAPWINANDVSYNYSGAIGSFDQRYLALPVAAPTRGVAFPYYGPSGANSFMGVYAPSVTTIGGDCTQKMGAPAFGQISLVNLASTAVLTARVRWGVEMIVAPNTSYAPVQRPPARFDPLALEAYSAISGDMADAYPASYNSLGKLGSVLKGIWNSVAPVAAQALMSIPHPVAQGLGAAAHLIGGLSGAADKHTLDAQTVAASTFKPPPIRRKGRKNKPRKPRGKPNKAPAAQAVKS